MIEREIQELGHTSRQLIEQANSLNELEEVRIRLLGRKEGRLTLLMRRLAQIPAEDRPRLGELANRLKNELTALIDERKSRLSGIRRLPQQLDVTLPGRSPWVGSEHLITSTMREIGDIFVRLGFREELGPEIEDDWHNYGALNFRPDHPARDTWAGFYLHDGWLLRSHTSPVQIRVMKSQSPPVRIVAPGRCYRPDPFDASHSPNFHQIEGLCIDRSISMAHLKGTLDSFVKDFFGPEVKTRLSPSYFPFTEPSAELSASCTICSGTGCSTCKGSGWLELAGCGMVHPNVLLNVGYDPQYWSGYAFGFGIERLAMIKHRLDDIRLFYENDRRFLQQF